MTDRRAKAARQAQHAVRRAKERFDIDLTHEKRLQINGMIHEGQTRQVQRRSLRVSIHELIFEGKLIHVVYDHKRHTLVTFLMPDWSDDEHHQSVRFFED